MESSRPVYRDYPWTVPFLENTVWIGVYVLGAAVFRFLHPWAAAGYLAYCLLCMYLLVPRLVCTSCSYYGRTCHSGQGRIAALLFPAHDATRFASCFRQMRFAAPVFLAPILAGAIALVLALSWTRVALTAAFAIAALGMTRAITRRLGCPHCAQQDVCPACRRG